MVSASLKKPLSHSRILKQDKISEDVQNCRYCFISRKRNTPLTPSLCSNITLLKNLGRKICQQLSWFVNCFFLFVIILEVKKFYVLILVFGRVDIGKSSTALG